VPLLAHYFLDIYGKKIGKVFTGISDGDLDRLTAYPWPGNVRELENIVERGTILSTPPRFRAPQLGGGRVESEPAGQTATLRENERRHILRALQETGWKVRGPGGAAELLDLHPSTLTFRMNKLGVKRPPKRRK